MSLKKKTDVELRILLEVANHSAKTPVQSEGFRPPGFPVLVYSYVPQNYHLVQMEPTAGENEASGGEEETSGARKEHTDTNPASRRADS